MLFVVAKRNSLSCSSLSFFLPSTMDDNSVVNVDGRKKQLHVMMFPWLAHAHMSSYLQLSNRLADAGVKVSFLSTPLNISKIRKSAGKLQLLELALPQVEGLPAGIENTMELPLPLLPLFNKALDGLENPFQQLLSQIRPHCVVFDFFQWWTATAAAKFGIPSVFFLTGGAAFAGYAINPALRGNKEISAQDLTKPPPDYPSSVISYKLFEAEIVLGLYKASEGISFSERFLRCYQNCSAMAIKSANEIEGSFVEYLQKVIGKPVFPVGPLLSVITPQAESTSMSSIWLTWLEKQRPGSVVYVAFGSQVFMSNEEIREIAMGLEGSLLPFLWALRLPQIHGERSAVTDVLPEGFEERVEGRGVVVGEWVDQREILRHPNTGAFMSHCGWNSVMEGMSSGLPFIASPMHLDQALNARLVCEQLKVGIEVERGGGGSLNREEISKAVRKVMVEEEGNSVRIKAREIGEILKNENESELYIDRFISHLQLLSRSLTAE